MEISNLYKKLRYFSNPNSLLSLSFISPSISFCSSHKTLFSSVNPAYTLSATQNPNSNSVFGSNLACKKPNLNTLSSILYSFQLISISSITSSSSLSLDISVYPFHSFYRSFSISPSHVSPFSTSPEKPDIAMSSRGVSYRIERIVTLIKGEENDLESKLNRLNESLSLSFIREIFRALNRDGISGLRFFEWVRETQPKFLRNSEFCCLVIDNLGRVEDYRSMLLVLKDLSRKEICLMENAFAFIPVYSSDDAFVRGTIKCVIEILKEAGGSCRNSGIFALIKRLCILNSFDLAIFVMEETIRKTSYYNVLIWAKCRSGNFQDALDLLDEMKRFGCDPNINSYNYLLSGLCKSESSVEPCSVLEVMEESDYPPDAVTFEVIICHACRLGRLDFAVEFLNQMMSIGLEPRLTTHAVLIKGYFYCDRFQEAYKYVVDMGVKYTCSGNMNYSLLAHLHQRKGRVIEAREILVDMIEKGLKPNFPVYIKVLKDLHKSGMRDLVADLKSRFSKLHTIRDAG